MSLALPLNAAKGQGVEPRPDLNANAALKYWRGFANLPKLDKDEQEKITQEAATMPLTPRVKEVVQLADWALHELYSGAAVPDCAWGITWEDGIGARLPEQQPGRLLAATACLRARLRFEEGHNAAAVDDLIAALTLARHLSLDGSLIGVLTHIAVENRALETLATYLPKLKAADLKVLLARLDRLPAGSNSAYALVRGEEKGFLDWFEKKVRSFKDREQLVTFLDALLENPGAKNKSEKGKALLEACGGNAEGILKQCEEARPFYATFAKKLALPPDEFAKEFAAERKRMEKNPVFTLFVPALDKVRPAEARLEVRQAMCRAAIAVLLDGEGVLKKHPEPYADSPFEYGPFAGGFELKATLKVKDKPWVLTVGKRK